jgi:PKD repeat protein
MKNIIFAIILSTFSIFSYSQNNFQLFSNIDNYSINPRDISPVKDAVYADLDQVQLRALSEESPDDWKITLPLSGRMESSELSMTKFDFVQDDLIVTGTSSGKIDYKKGNYYVATGINQECIGTFSVYEDNLMGVVGFENGDNFNIGEIRNMPGKYIIFRDKDFKEDISFYCDTEEYGYSEGELRDLVSYPRNDSQKCIDIYIEADFALYVQNGKSIIKTVDFVLGLFAETALLYKKEGINIKVSSIKVWQSPDSYDTTSSHKALDQFGHNNTDSDTDLNLLVALGGNGLGGVAFVNALCKENIHFAYANIDISYNNIPSYSWSVMVITHELGHNLGSNHTHSCRWFGNDTQIDDCGNVYYYSQGQTPEGSVCFNPDSPIIPLDGGTIMSYCHLVGVAGINLSKGFGEQPGNLIRKRVNDSECVDSCESFGDTIPVAKFTSSTLTCVDGEVKFKDLSDNFPNEWVWIFENQTGSDTSFHKFPVMKYLNEGKFDVTLIASNAIGSDTIFKEDYINVIPGPVAGFSYEMIDSQTVKFNNASENADKYFWKFGDANVSFEKNPKHKFNNAGFFIVELRATKDTCNTHNYFTDTIEIKIPIRASIIYNKSEICPGDSIFFQAANVGYDSVRWAFQGGNIEISTLSKFYVVYHEKGEFDVSFIAFSKYGIDTLYKEKLIKVFGIPEILFDFQILEDTVYFANDSKDASTFTWNFGDSTSSQLLNPMHIYKDNGKYLVTLTGKNLCFSSELQKEIIIEKVSNKDNDIDDLEIFPNPSSGLFHIAGKDKLEGIKWLKINNLKGDQVYFKNSFSDYNSGLLDINAGSIPAGIYNVEIFTTYNIIYKKLVIIK